MLYLFNIKYWYGLELHNVKRGVHCISDFASLYISDDAEYDKENKNDNNNHFKNEALEK